jgi:phage terminase small subunit
MARPKKPEVLKALEGDRGKGRRPGSQNPPRVAGYAECPEHVTGYAAEVWARVARSMPKELYGECDSDLLAAYCRAADGVRVASLGLADAVEVEDVNKWMTIFGKAVTSLVGTGAKLGLDPSSRSAMVMPSGQKEESKFSGLVAMTGGRKG